jgi:hypothetical protein
MVRFSSRLPLLLLTTSVLAFQKADAKWMDVTTDVGRGADAYVESGQRSADPLGVDDEEQLGIRSGTSSSLLIRKTYLRFDLSHLPDRSVLSASLSLFADENDSIFPNLIEIYGINDGSLGDDLLDWEETSLTWNDAPQRGSSGTDTGSDTTLLTKLEVFATQGNNEQRFEFAANQEFIFPATRTFTDFLNADTNDLVTFIAVYDQDSGSTLRLASKENTEDNPPVLRVAVPSPSSLALLALGLLTFTLARRKTLAGARKLHRVCS